jgi:mono/diheme cytochrome c family protein
MPAPGLLAALVCAAALSGCHLDMWNQRRYEPLEKGAFFGEKASSARPLVEGTVPYQLAKLDTHYYEGRVNGELAAALPAQVALTRELLERGQARFAIYCMPCHGETGHGDGMVVQRGFPQPPSYMDPRLLETPIGHFFDVPSKGFGRMYSYASRVSVDDRWAIAAYIRTLQLSQNATPDLLPPDILAEARRPRPGEETGDAAAGATPHD